MGKAVTPKEKMAVVAVRKLRSCIEARFEILNLLISLFVWFITVKLASLRRKESCILLDPFLKMKYLSLILMIARILHSQISCGFVNFFESCRVSCQWYFLHSTTT